MRVNKVKETIAPMKKLSIFRLYSIILVLIVIFGFFLRVYKLSSLSLYGDELTIAYDAYSILKTGKDQTGEAFPLTFKMGAGRPAGYVYASIPFVALFGPSVWGVRGLSLFSGLGIIVLMYFLGKRLLNKKVGIIASFLTSISMWDIYLSRGGFEAHFALFLALLGMVLFLNKKYIIWAISWGLAILTYPTFKLTLPLMFLVLLMFKGIKANIKSKLFWVGIVILAIFAGFSLNETFKGTSEERFLRINIFSDNNLRESVVQKINEQRNLNILPENIKPLIYNKPVSYLRIIFENYVDNLSPRFLYLRGDGNPRHNPGEWGMFYLAELFLVLVALRNLKPKILYLLFSWILIVPLATMFLGQTHGLRNCFMLPPFILLSAYGLTKLSPKIKILAFGLIGMQLMYVLVTIYYFAPVKFGSFWSETAKEASYFSIENKKNYEKIILPTTIDNIEYAYPVYAKLDPNLVISQYGNLPKVYDNVIITDNIKEYKNDENVLILEKWNENF